MSLSAREQHALDSIETALAGSDPDLALLLATFGRLTSGEEMPVREKIRKTRWFRRGRHRGPRRGRSVSRRRNGVWTGAWSRTWGAVRRLRRRLGWQWAGMLIWVLVSVGLITLAPYLNRSGHRMCPVSWAAACSARTTAHTAQPAGKSHG
jgi:hypothetical protein